MSPKDRRPLSDGLKPEPEVDPELAREFVYQGKSKSVPSPEPKQASRSQLAADSVTPAAQEALVPLTARIAGKKFHATKRASFDRQLQGVKPNTIQDIVDEALTSWLKKHGYLP
jgi:hypothetical protein